MRKEGGGGEGAVGRLQIRLLDVRTAEDGRHVAAEAVQLPSIPSNGSLIELARPLSSDEPFLARSVSSPRMPPPRHGSL